MAGFENHDSDGNSGIKMIVIEEGSISISAGTDVKKDRY